MTLLGSSILSKMSDEAITRLENFDKNKMMVQSGGGATVSDKHHRDFYIELAKFLEKILKKYETHSKKISTSTEGMIRKLMFSVVKILVDLIKGIASIVPVVGTVFKAIQIIDRFLKIALDIAVYSSEILNIGLDAYDDFVEELIESDILKIYNLINAPPIAQVGGARSSKRQSLKPSAAPPPVVASEPSAAQPPVVASKPSTVPPPVVASKPSTVPPPPPVVASEPSTVPPPPVVASKPSADPKSFTSRIEKSGELYKSLDIMEGLDKEINLFMDYVKQINYKYGLDILNNVDNIFLYSLLKNISVSLEKVLHRILEYNIPNNLDETKRRLEKYTRYREIFISRNVPELLLTSLDTLIEVLKYKLYLLVKANNIFKKKSEKISYTDSNMQQFLINRPPKDNNDCYLF
jgi:hypothetical protein